jgi:hypothetical protein
MLVDISVHDLHRVPPSSLAALANTSSRPRCNYTIAAVVLSRIRSTSLFSMQIQLAIIKASTFSMSAPFSLVHARKSSISLPPFPAMYLFVPGVRNSSLRINCATRMPCFFDSLADSPSIFSKINSEFASKVSFFSERPPYLHWNVPNEVAIFWLRETIERLWTSNTSHSRFSELIASSTDAEE